MASMSLKEATEILGVTLDQSDKEIRKAYLTLVKENHPDRGGDSEKMKLINDAKTILDIYCETRAKNIEAYNKKEAERKAREAKSNKPKTDNKNQNNAEKDNDPYYGYGDYSGRETNTDKYWNKQTKSNRDNFNSWDSAWYGQGTGSEQQNYYRNRTEPNNAKSQVDEDDNFSKDIEQEEIIDKTNRKFVKTSKSIDSSTCNSIESIINQCKKSILNYNHNNNLASKTVRILRDIILLMITPIVMYFLYLYNDSTHANLSISKVTLVLGVIVIIAEFMFLLYDMNRTITNKKKSDAKVNFDYSLGRKSRLTVRTSNNSGSIESKIIPDLSEQWEKQQKAWKIQLESIKKFSIQLIGENATLNRSAITFTNKYDILESNVKFMVWPMKDGKTLIFMPGIILLNIKNYYKVIPIEEINQSFEYNKVHLIKTNDKYAPDDVYSDEVINGETYLVRGQYKVEYKTQYINFETVNTMYNPLWESLLG